MSIEFSNYQRHIPETCEKERLDSALQGYALLYFKGYNFLKLISKKKKKIAVKLNFVLSSYHSEIFNDCLYIYNRELT